MRITGARWTTAQYHERRFWKEFQDPDKKWVNLWKSQADYLWPLVPDPGHVLEIGPGVWGLIRWAPENKDLWAIDPLAAYFPWVLSRYDSIGLRTDIKYTYRPTEDYLPEYNRKFNYVIAMNCLDHMEFPERALDNLFLYLDPMGYFFESTTIFNYKHPDILNQYTEQHPWVWTWGELLDLVTEHGFIIENEYEDWPCHENFTLPGSNSHQRLRAWRPWR